MAAPSTQLIQHNFPPKYKDPGCPTISITIGQTTLENCLLDLGASVNLIPYFVFKTLNLGKLKPTNLQLRLVDRSTKIPKGVIEDVIVKVNDFYYPADFIILEIEPTLDGPQHYPIILGRPFLPTVNTAINSPDGSMRITFENMTLDINIFNQHPHLIEDLNEVSTINTYVAYPLYHYESYNSLFTSLTTFDPYPLDTGIVVPVHRWQQPWLIHL